MADAVKVKDPDGNITFLSPEYLEKFPDEGFTLVDPADDPYAGLIVSGPNVGQTLVEQPAPEVAAADVTPDTKPKASHASTKKDND